MAQKLAPSRLPRKSAPQVSVLTYDTFAIHSHGPLRPSLGIISEIISKYWYRRPVLSWMSPGQKHGPWREAAAWSSTNMYHLKYFGLEHHPCSKRHDTCVLYLVPNTAYKNPSLGPPRYPFIPPLRIWPGPCLQRASMVQKQTTRAP